MTCFLFLGEVLTSLVLISSCFGKYLRKSSSKWFTPDGRVIGSPEVSEQRLKSLERLLADHHRQKYPAHVKTVTEMSVQQCTESLLNDFTEDDGPVKRITSRVLREPSEK